MLDAGDAASVGLIGNKSGTLSAQLGPDGRAIGVISEDYGRVSNEIEQRIGQVTQSAAALFRKIYEVNFLLCTARLQEEVSDVFAAEPAQLREFDIDQRTLVLFRALRETARRLAERKVKDMPVLTNWQQLIDYCHTALAHEKTEQFRILFLDRKNVLIADEVQQRGTIDHTPVYPREVVKRALAHNAAALILVHNHPSGDPKPSRDDIEMTKEIAKAAEALGIAIHDHLVIGRKGHASFRSLGLL